MQPKVLTTFATKCFAGLGKQRVPRDDGNRGYRPTAKIFAKHIATCLENFPLTIDIVPKNKSIEVVPGGKEHSTFCLFRQPVCESNILLGLRPTRYQKHVDHNPLLSALHGLSHRLFFRARIRRIHQVQHLTLEVSCWEAVSDQNDLLVGRIGCG